MNELRTQNTVLRALFVGQGGRKKSQFEVLLYVV